MKGRNRTVFGVLLVAILATSCTQYKPQGRAQLARGNAGSAGADDNLIPAGTGPNAPALLIDNTKLAAAPGSYRAVLLYEGATVSHEFTPEGPSTRVPIAGLPAKAVGLLTVELYQGEAIRFVAKRAQTTFEATGAPIVVDDCLILPTPWNGQQHQGSCAWTIEDVN